MNVAENANASPQIQFGSSIGSELCECLHDHPAEHAIYAILNAQLRTYPYAHILLSDVFPSDFYLQLLDNLPEDQAYTPASNGKYPERGRLMLAGDAGHDLERLSGPRRAFWEHVVNEVLTERFWGALVERFVPSIASRLKETCWLHAFLSRDRGGYAISPHTDTTRKLISVLIYLPTNAESMACGTSIAVSDQPEHNVFNVPHSRGWEGFKIAKTAPFAPNSMIAFLVSDTSLHAVRPTPKGSVRNTLQFNIMMPNQ